MRGSLKRGAELALVRSGLAGAWRRASGRDVVVLAYHNVVPSGDNPAGDSSLHLPLSSFSAQIDVLCETHSVVPLRDLMGAGRRERKPLAAITFDDAYRGALELGLPELLREDELDPVVHEVCVCTVEPSARWSERGQGNVACVKVGHRSERHGDRIFELFDHDTLSL